MDKYEYKVKLAQIEKLVTKKDYVTAAKIADGIDWRKVKSVTTLSMIADIYEENDRLEDCYEILNMVYDRSPIGRGVVYRMTEIATKMHDFEEAIDLYKEFVRIAPHDLSKYILKYQIYRERGSSVEDQIVILEEFKSHEYDERWAYELACLYEEAGQISRCIEECDELILWFNEGEYVAKAMELKMKYQDLSASQQEKFAHRYDYLEPAQPEEFYDEDDETLDQLPEDELTPAYKAVENAKQKQLEEEDDTPHVSEINTNKFSTMNLQAELAKGLQELLEQVEKEALEEAAAAPQAVKTPAVTRKTAPLPTPMPAAAPVRTAAPVMSAAPMRRESPGARSASLPTMDPVRDRTALSETAELHSEILKYATVAKEPAMEQLLRTEEDGQIGLDIAEENILEKQITGQMSIGEILEAWEEKKRQAKLRQENPGDGRQAVLYETGEITSLLQDFIPRTPKDAQEIIEEIEAEKAMREEPPFYAEVPVMQPQPQPEPEPEPIPVAAAPEKEEPVTAVPYEEPKVFAPSQELEDDLPLDIDYEDGAEEEYEMPADETLSAMTAPIPVAEAVAAAPEIAVAAPETPKPAPMSQNTASMLDAIERALVMEATPGQTAGKYLTEEQEKIFAYFTSVEGMKKQLVTLLSEDAAYTGKQDSREGNLIITGHPGNGKTTLAIDIVKAIQKQRSEKGGKIAKVTGDGMNKKDPLDVVRKLGGGALIIERAGGMNDVTAEKLAEAMEGLTGGLLVILEDDAAEIKELMSRHGRLSVKFNRTVNIPIFSNDELVAFGKSYAEEQEFYFDEMAVLALYDCIGVRQTSDHVVNITEVKGFVDDAIAHAEKKSRGIFARLSKKRIDEYGNRLLLEEDFDY